MMKSSVAVRFEPTDVIPFTNFNDALWDRPVFSPDNRLIASVLALSKTEIGHHLPPEANLVRVWDTVTGQELFTLAGHSDRVNTLAFTPNGQHLFSGSSDGTMRVWDLCDGCECQVLRGHEGHVLTVIVSPDGEWVISRSGDRTASPEGYPIRLTNDRKVRIWDWQQGKELTADIGDRSDTGHLNYVSTYTEAYCFVSHTRIAIKPNQVPGVWQWDRHTQSIVGSVPSLTNKEWIDHAHKRVLRHRSDGLWCVDTQELLFVRKQDSDHITWDMEVTLDGKVVITSLETRHPIPPGNDRRGWTYTTTYDLAAWDLATNAEIQPIIRDEPKRATKLTLSQDGTRLAAWVQSITPDGDPQKLELFIWRVCSINQAD